MAINCNKCGEKETLFEAVDSWGCIKCDEWKEDKCKDADCEFCTTRKDKPSEYKTK